MAAAATVEEELRQQVATLMATQAETTRRLAEMERDVDAKDRELRALKQVVVDLRSADQADAGGADSTTAAAATDGAQPAQQPQHQQGPPADEFDWGRDVDEELATLRARVDQLEADNADLSARLEDANRSLQQQAATADAAPENTAPSAAAPDADDRAAAAHEMATLRELREADRQQIAALEDRLAVLSQELTELRAAPPASPVPPQGQHDSGAAAVAQPMLTTLGGVDIASDAGSAAAASLSVDEVAVLLRHDNICLEDENMALRSMVDALVRDRTDSKETMQHLVRQLESLQGRLRVERERQDAIVSARSSELEQLYSGILLDKQDQLDAAQAKLRLLEGTVAEMQQSLVRGRFHRGSAAGGDHHAPSASSSVVPQHEQTDAAASLYVPKYHSRTTPALGLFDGHTAPAGGTRSLNDTSASHGSAGVDANSWTPPPQKPARYVPAALRSAILGDV